MDQVKLVLRHLNAQKFWVTVGFLAILPVVFWFLSKSELDERTQSRKSKIESAYNTKNSVSGISDHPNPQTASGMDANIAKLKTSVYDAWLDQYEQQKKVLVWPTELEQDFRERVEEFRPIEVVAFPTPAAEELRPEFLEE